MIKVSVVIPIYNVEKYLDICLDSIVNQTLKDIEIICINDGSTDKSLDILNEYATKDDRITVISQKNQGHAVATNKGMDLTTGKYLYLMDSDDKIELDTLEKTYNIAEEKDVDFVLFQAINYDESENRYYKTENYSMTTISKKVKGEIFNYKDLGLSAFIISVTPWTKLYRRDFIVNCGARFPEGLIFEDNVFFWDMFFSAKRIYFLEEYLFTRRWHNDSSTKAGDKRFIDSLTVNDLVIDVFKKHDVFNEENRIKLYNRKIKTGFNRYTQIKDEYKELYYEAMKENFMKWVEDTNFYDYLSYILELDNHKILDCIILSKNHSQFKYLIEQYTLTNDTYRFLEKNDIRESQLKYLKNDNEKLVQKEIQLSNEKNNLIKIIEKISSSSCWKLIRPIYTVLRLLKNNN